MSATLILTGLLGYFAVLMIIAQLTGRKSDNQSFFLGNKRSPWYVVAFGMIGASLSGITFISIPGTVDQAQFGYMQIVLGYLAGYAVIALVLMPLYYRLNLVSIYTYLGQRLGPVAYKTGSVFFLLSRVIGAALRLYLVATVLQEFVFNQWSIPFEVTVTLSIVLIWVYTYRGGIRTIIWTDTLQTLFMLIALGWSIVLIAEDLNLGWGNLFETIDRAGYGTWFQTDDPLAANYFIKQFVAGAFIAICMTGLDQDMMQKNLSCPNIREAQKNMVSFSAVLFFVNLAFLALGALLFLYADAHDGIWETMVANERDNDLLFPTIALEGGLGTGLGIVFLLGLIAAAYSSADSALTSLTTSVCVDLLNIEAQPEAQQVALRKRVHLVVSGLLLLTIVVFRWVKSDNVIWELFRAAQYTYGPLLGMFSFSLFTRFTVKDKLVPLACGIAIVVTMLISNYSTTWFGGYAFGFELIVVNGLLTFLLLLAIARPATDEPA